MTSYLRTYFDQYGFLASGGNRSDVDALLAAAFESYFSSLSLLGHPDKGARLIDRLRAIGADEAACLIDFGVDAPSILEALPALDRLRARCEVRPEHGQPRTLTDQQGQDNPRP